MRGERRGGIWPTFRGLFGTMLAPKPTPDLFTWWIVVQCSRGVGPYRASSLVLNKQDRCPSDDVLSTALAVY